MTPERWEQVGKLYQAALPLQPDERDTFLNDACGDDTAMRREVESLLAAEDGAGSFLAAGAMKDAARMLVEEKSLSLVAKELGHYQVLSLLGAGGMGEVYLAEDTRLKRKVALKLLPTELTANQDRLRRFEQQAQAASGLNHPNIITIHEIGQVDGLNFIVTEFIAGETLRQRLAMGQMNLPVVLDVAAQAASALAAAHAVGIVHRDLKPENIMLRPDGLIKVLDFGLAKLIEPRTSNVDTEAATVARVDTKMGTVMGTAQYMSPEQARGLKVDARTDIFSLGVVLYEMLAGRAPFTGETTADIISLLLQKEPHPLSTLAPDTPGELQSIISKALRKDKDERYQTVKDLLIDLTTLKQELEFTAKLERSAAPKSRVSASIASGGQSSATIDQSVASTLEVSKAHPTSSAEYLITGIKQHKLAAVVALLVIAAGVVGLAAYLRTRNPEVNIESIAVLPFVNPNNDPNTEYLADGIPESIINSLSQLPNLKVMSRNSVFHYKGKEMDAQAVAKELKVRAVLTGRVTQRADGLSISVELINAQDNSQIWGQQYNRKLTDVFAIQEEIAKEISEKLRLRLTGEEKKRVTKRYTDNTEAYQLYLKGRYHLAKLTPPEIQTSISYFQQAIDLDPSYALAYAGLADAYRSFALVGEMPANEFFPKAKAAAQKAIEIDDTLAEAHAELGFTIFWYDWDWNAAENQLKRALDLNPNSADPHLFYAHLLSNTGRHAEGLAEVKRARELDPLDLRINSLEAQFLDHAGKPDEALALLQKNLELNPNNWFAHMFASSAYTEKGMFAEAVVEASKARELNRFNSQPTAQLGYAWAKSGKQAEARGVLEELLKRSAEHYVSPGNIALIYNGLDERDKTLQWLERGFEQRDVKMVFLKVEPKWNNLRSDSRFRDLLRRVGF